jgi:large subunit ribosomal protein L7e
MTTQTQRKMRKLKKARLSKRKLTLSVPVPEGLRKAWERENRAKKIRMRARKRMLRKLPQKKATQAARIAGYEREYAEIKTERQASVLKARLEGNFFKPLDPQMAVVIRIRGINRLSPKVRKVMELLRLLQIHNAVFIKLNKATINMLKLVQPYIAYGYPSVATIRSMIYKRGFAKIRHRPGAISRIPIMSNLLIEKNLGKFGIQTVEDVVHSLSVVDRNFTRCANFLWPFKLNCPKGGYRGRKRRHYNEGGTYGNWEFHINTLCQRML